MEHYTSVSHFNSDTYYMCDLQHWTSPCEIFLPSAHSKGPYEVTDTNFLQYIKLSRKQTRGLWQTITLMPRNHSVILGGLLVTRARCWVVSRLRALSLSCLLSPSLLSLHPSNVTKNNWCRCWNVKRVYPAIHWDGNNIITIIFLVIISTRFSSSKFVPSMFFRI